MKQDKKEKQDKKDLLSLGVILFLAGSVIFIASAFLYVATWHITTII